MILFEAIYNSHNVMYYCISPWNTCLLANKKPKITGNTKHTSAHDLSLPLLLL